MKKLLMAIILTFLFSLLLAKNVYSAPSEVSGEPYWSCYTENYWHYVGWPRLFERRTRTVCEVRE